MAGLPHFPHNDDCLLRNGCVMKKILLRLVGAGLHHETTQHQEQGLKVSSFLTAAASLACKLFAYYLLVVDALVKGTRPKDTSIKRLQRTALPKRVVPERHHSDSPSLSPTRQAMLPSDTYPSPVSNRRHRS